MKKKNRVNSSRNYGLLRVRDLLGFGQIEMASNLGMPQATYGAVEIGTRKLNRATAEKIFILTGSDPEDLVDGAAKESWSGECMTVGSLEKWQSMDYDEKRCAVCRIVEKRIEQQREWGREIIKIITPD